MLLVVTFITNEARFPIEVMLNCTDISILFHSKELSQASVIPFPTKKIFCLESNSEENLDVESCCVTSQALS